MGLSIQLTDQTPWDTENLASCIAGPNKHYAKLRELWRMGITDITQVTLPGTRTLFDPYSFILKFPRCRPWEHQAYSYLFDNATNIPLRPIPAAPPQADGTPHAGPRALEITVHPPLTPPTYTQIPRPIPVALLATVTINRSPCHPEFDIAPGTSASLYLRGQQVFCYNAAGRFQGAIPVPVARELFRRFHVAQRAVPTSDQFNETVCSPRTPDSRNRIVPLKAHNVAFAPSKHCATPPRSDFLQHGATHQPAHRRAHDHLLLIGPPQRRPLRRPAATILHQMDRSLDRVCRPKCRRRPHRDQLRYQIGPRRDGRHTDGNHHT